MKGKDLIDQHDAEARESWTDDAAEREKHKPPTTTELHAAAMRRRFPEMQAMWPVKEAA